MSKLKNYPKDVFVDLKGLLQLETVGRRFSFLAKNQKVNSVLGGRHASRIRGRGLDFEEVRGYVNGDDIRTLDWKVTARTKNPHIRVYSEEKERPVFIVTDQSRSMFFGSVRKTKAVVAAELAAITAFSVLNDGDRVGGMVFADKGNDILYPKRDRRNIYRFLEKIVQRNRELADTEGLDFSHALKDAAQKLTNLVTHDFLVVIISDFFRFDPNVLRVLSRISRHNDVILARVTDPLERELPSGDLMLGDGKVQIELKAGAEKTRRQYSEAVEGELSEFRDNLRKYRIPLLEFNTSDPIDEQFEKQVAFTWV